MTCTEVVEAFAAYAAEEALARGVHQRRAKCSLQDANARALGDTVEFRAELGVAVADDEVRSSPERRELAKLMRRPAFIGFASDCDVDHLLGVHVDDEEGEERSKPDVVGLDEVARPDGVALQERTPALPVPRRSDRADVALNGALGNPESELQKLAADALCAPGARCLACYWHRGTMRRMSSMVSGARRGSRGFEALDLRFQ